MLLSLSVSSSPKEETILVLSRSPLLVFSFHYLSIMLKFCVFERVCNTFFLWASEAAISFDWTCDVVGCVRGSVSCPEMLVSIREPVEQYHVGPGYLLHVDLNQTYVCNLSKITVFFFKCK